MFPYFYSIGATHLTKTNKVLKIVCENNDNSIVYTNKSAQGQLMDL